MRKVFVSEAGVLVDEHGTLLSKRGVSAYTDDGLDPEASSSGTSGANTFTDPAGLRWRPSPDVGELIVKEAGSGARSPWEVAHDDTEGYILHLVGADGMTGAGGSGGALIGLGVNFGGVGLFVNNYLTGVGIKITNRASITNVSAWGLLLSQNSDQSEGMYLSQETSTAKMPLKIVNAPIGAVGGAGASAGQIMTEWRRSQAATGDTLLARISVDSAVFQVPVTLSGAALAVTGGITADDLIVTAAGVGMQLWDTAGTANQRRFKWSISAGLLVLSARNDAGASAGDVLYIKHTNGDITPKDGATIIGGAATGLKIGNAASKLGFYNAAPVVKPTGVAVDAAGIHAALVSLGLIAA